MGADQVLSGAWIHAQEIALVPLALHLPPIVPVRSELEHHTLTKDGYRLEALVPSDVLVTGTSSGLDLSSADHLSRPGHKPSHQF